MPIDNNTPGQERNKEPKAFGITHNIENHHEQHRDCKEPRVYYKK